MSPAEEDVLAAVMERLDAADAFPLTLQQAQDLGESGLPAYYTEVTLSPRFGAPNRMTATTNARAWRLTTRAVGKQEENAREMRARADSAIRFHRFVVEGKTSTPTQFETGEAVAEDDTWFSGLTAWTFVT